MGKITYHPELTYSGFKEGKFDKAILAVGSAENHGFHLPFGTDTLVAQAIAQEVAQQVEGLLMLPPINYGVSHHYAHYQFTLTLSSETMNLLLQEVFRSVIRQGIHRILVINGHDGNIAPIETAARSVKVSTPTVFIASLDAWWITARELLPPDTFEIWNGRGHAGEGETSLMLHLFPELCRMENARGVVPDIPAGLDIKWTFDELTPYGATGDPTHATPEKGKKMFDLLVNRIVHFVKEMEERNWRYGMKRD
ncbi:MAG TPA: creatininase family protein [Atribacteraceae bacterium]|nr:creatininase family protein [Atribacteraceae bacterium]